MAEFNDFITCVEDYFAKADRLLRPGQKKVYREMIATYPIESVRETIEHFSRITDRFPQANEFGQVLLNFATGGREREQDIEERATPCETCGVPSVEFYANNGWKRFSDSGGLMYILVDQIWYAALCWACQGPPRLRHRLVVPQLMQRPHYKAEADTPLAALRAAAVEEAFRVGIAGLLSDNAERVSPILECQTWESRAIRHASECAAQA